MMKIKLDTSNFDAYIEELISNQDLILYEKIRNHIYKKNGNIKKKIYGE